MKLGHDIFGTNLSTLQKTINKNNFVQEVHDLKKFSDSQKMTKNEKFSKKIFCQILTQARSEIQIFRKKHEITRNAFVSELKSSQRMSTKKLGSKK